MALVAIAKGQPAQALRTLAQAGQRHFGENYLQEALPKLAALADLDLTWHFTGQLQANKTRSVAEHFHWVHTVDRERIAIRLSEQRPAAAPILNICIQVRLADEDRKGGVDPSELGDLARARTQVIRDALLAGGQVDPKRVYVLGLKPVAAVDGKVRVELALK